MPLYEYACTDCERTFETLVLPGETVTECPNCHSPRVERQLSLPAQPPSSLPVGCDPSLPPCSPTCCRLPASSRN
jgi:putative FmdB family regulatory protein